jgi:hypothetical protein
VREGRPKVDKRRDDRDAQKSLDRATDDPREANKTDESQQAAELQVGAEGERQDPARFEPDQKGGNGREGASHSGDERPAEAREKEYDPEP